MAAGATVPGAVFAAVVCADETELVEEELEDVLAATADAVATEPEERTISLNEILNWPGCVVAMEEAVEAAVELELGGTTGAVVALLVVGLVLFMIDAQDCCCCC